MPTTRSSGGSRASSGRQATLSFNHRVTKSVPKSAKDISSTGAAKSPLAKHVVNVEPEVKEEKAKIKKEEDDEEEEEKLEGFDEEEEEEEEEAVVEPERERTEAELRAAYITSRQINQYWRGIESERRTKRIHQQDLSTAEKILRYWDVSSQYGPCIGISRTKRWQRAERLGLKPPVEVLAVLMKEEENGTESIERAHMDDILNSTAVGAE